MGVPDLLLDIDGLAGLIQIPNLQMKPAAVVLSNH
jgi:hypothetical protein